MSNDIQKVPRKIKLSWNLEIKKLEELEIKSNSLFSKAEDRTKSK